MAVDITYVSQHGFNPLNAELNPICHLLALLGGATIVVVSRLRVKEQNDACIGASFDGSGLSVPHCVAWMHSTHAVEVSRCDVITTMLRSTCSSCMTLQETIITKFKFLNPRSPLRKI